MSYLSCFKVLNHPERYKSWYERGDTFAPVTVKIDLTNKCNHNCYYCIDSALRGTEELSWAVVTKLLTNLHANGVKGVHFTGGGEPLLHPKAIEIIEKARDIGLECGLITNGSLLVRLNIERLCGALTWMRVSLDAHDEESYKANRGPAANWERTLSGIKKAIACGTCDISVSHLTGIKNQDVQTFIIKMGEIGVKAVQISPLMGSSPSPTLPACWPSPTVKVIVHKEKYEAQERKYSFCHGQSFKATNICADGNVYVCCQLAGIKSARIGNIHEKKFSDIWHSQQRKEVLRSLDVSKCPPTCVCDSLNTFLDNIKKLDHINSL